MSNCSSSCATQDHATFGECVRAKSLRVAYCQSADGKDYTKQKRWDRELNAYEDARAEGIQPSGTSMAKIQQAKDASDRMGAAFDGTKVI